MTIIIHKRNNSDIGYSEMDISVQWKVFSDPKISIFESRVLYIITSLWYKESRPGEDFFLLGFLQLTINRYKFCCFNKI